MKPGVSLHTTGTLPQAFIRVVIRGASASSVARPGTTSTKGSRGAGLKKCRPTMRSGCFRPPAMAVTDREEVFVASTASAVKMPSSSAKSFFLMPRSSMMASMTSPLSLSSLRSLAGVMRPWMPSACSAVSLPFSTSLSSVFRRPASALSTASRRVSNSTTACPACAATWAMPLPIVPAPITATVIELSMHGPPKLVRRRGREDRIQIR